MFYHNSYILYLIEEYCLIIKVELKLVLMQWIAIL
jgi:hypothetical protein